MSATEGISSESDQVISPGFDINPRSARRSASIHSITTSVDSRRSSTSSRPRTSTESTRRTSTVNPISDRAPRLTTPITPSPDDRVFPMRSVVSVDPTQTPFQTSDASDSFPGFSASSASEADERKIKRNGSAQKLSIRTSGRGMTSDDYVTSSENSRPTSPTRRYDISRRSFAASRSDYGKSTASGSSGSTLLTAGVADYILSPNATKDGDLEGYPVTARFKHIITDNGHAVITGRGGDTLQRCEDEPIHMPGAVQGFGLLVVLEEEQEGKLVVRTVSENSQKIIGYEPHELFALSSFTDILAEEQADNLLDHIDFIRDEDADVASNGPEVFTLSLRRPLQQPGRNKGFK